MSDDRTVLKKVHQLRNATSRIFQEKWDSAKENARFLRLLQYSEPQLAKISADKRVPYVLDYVTNSINTYLGHQRDQRTDIAYLPVNSDSEIKVEVANAVKDSLLRRNDFIYLESEIFQDGIIEKLGCVGYEWSKEKSPLGELRIFRIPPRQLTWDLNRRNYSIQESSWVSRTRLYQKKTLAEKFPEFAKEIMRMSLNANLLDSLALDETYTKQIVDTDLDSLGLVEFYEKDYKTRYFLIDSGGNVGDDFFDNKKDAEKEIKKRLQMFNAALSQIPQGQQLPPQPSYRMNDDRFPIIRKSEVLHNLVLTNEEQTDEPFFPYDNYHPFWHDGEWWSVMDTLKDAQRFINKMFQMVDHQIGINSKGLLLIDQNVPEKKANQIIKGYSTAGGGFRIKDPEHNVKFIPPASFDPRLLSAMDVAIVNLEKKSGGGNYLGHQETSGESGRAIQQRVAQGSLSSFVVYDNLSRWKRSVGEKVLWYITNLMTAAQKVRLEGKELTQTAQQMFPQWFEPSMKESFGFLKINTSKENSLEGLEADVIVDEAKHSATKNESMLNQLSFAMQSSPVLSETIPPQLLISLMPLPATEKEKWMQSAEQMLQARMEQQKAQNQKPPSITASLKDIEGLDFEAQAQFIAKYFGIQIKQGINGIQAKDALDAQKAVADNLHRDAELHFKKQKHADQTQMKGLQLLSTHNLGQQQIEAQKEKKDAVQE